MLTEFQVDGVRTREFCTHNQQHRKPDRNPECNRDGFGRTSHQVGTQLTFQVIRLLKDASTSASAHSASIQRCTTLKMYLGKVAQSITRICTCIIRMLTKCLRQGPMSNWVYSIYYGLPIFILYYLVHNAHHVVTINEGCGNQSWTHRFPFPFPRGNGRNVLCKLTLKATTRLTIHRSWRTHAILKYDI